MGTKGTAAADVTAILCVVLSVMWIVILAAPVNWHQAMLNNLFRFETSLYQVKVSSQAVEAEVLISEQVVISAGTWSLKDMQDALCKVQNQHCDAFSKLHIASWGMILAGSFVVLCLWLLASFMLYFWHVDSTEAGRKFMKVVLYLGPLVSIISVTAYFFMTKGFGDDAKTLANTPGFWVAISLTVLSFVPLVLFEVFINHDAMHRVHERRVQKELLLREYGDKHHMYGGTAGSPGDVGWQPQIPGRPHSIRTAPGGPPSIGSEQPVDPFLAGDGRANTFPDAFPKHWGVAPS